MSLKKFGGALALVLGLALSACGGSGGGGGGGGGGSGKACLWAEDGETLGCTDFTGSGFTKKDAAEMCDPDPLKSKCPSSGLVGVCEFNTGTDFLVREYYYDALGEAASDLALFCEMMEGVWVKG